MKPTIISEVEKPLNLFWAMTLDTSLCKVFAQNMRFSAYIWKGILMRVRGCCYCKKESLSI